MLSSLLKAIDVSRVGEQRRYAVLQAGFLTTTEDIVSMETSHFTDEEKKNKLENQETPPFLLFCKVLVDDLIAGGLVRETKPSFVQQQAVFTF
jgi:hypothetical protein